MTMRFTTNDEIAGHWIKAVDFIKSREFSGTEVPVLGFYVQQALNADIGI
jgi:hypothetical protein